MIKELSSTRVFPVRRGLFIHRLHVCSVGVTRALRAGLEVIEAGGAGGGGGETVSNTNYQLTVKYSLTQPNTTPEHRPIQTALNTRLSLTPDQQVKA